MRPEYKSVTFEHGGRKYDMHAKHLRWKGRSYFRAVWYEYDYYWESPRERLARLSWISLNGEPVFFDRSPNSQEFSQALGEFLFKELGVKVED